MKTLNFNTMKKLLFAILISLPLLSNAQQDAMFTHYSFNTLAVNPGYAGSRDALTITALHRSQWVGFEGAPITQTLTLHSPAFNERVGLGLSIVKDKIGPLNNTSLFGDFAYKVKLSSKGTLSFGVKGGFNLLQANLTSLDVNQNNDPAFATDVQNKFLPNFGFGWYYSTTRWYVGFSTPKFLQNSYNTSNDVFLKGGEKRHYFLITGAVFDLSKSFKIKPTTFLKITKAAPIELDLTALFIYKDKFEIGPMFRTGDALGALMGFYLNPQLRLGYSFDWSFTNRTGRYNNGSHEVVLRYDFIYKQKSKVYSPRYF